MIKGINTKGQFIAEKTSFDLFWGKRVEHNVSHEEIKKYSIVFGRNGSGKTTISKAVLDYKNNNEDTFETFLYDENNKEISFNKDNIYVFSESFVNDNIMIVEDGDLNAIVLFGKAGDVDIQIQELNKTIENEAKAIIDLDLEKYHRDGDDKNIDRALNNILGELKNHWAYREQKIKNLSRKANVDSNIIDSLFKQKKPSETKTRLENRFEELISMIDKVRNFNGLVNNIYLEIKIDNLSYYNDLLSTSFSKKQMTSFALDVLNQIESTSSRFLDESKKTLISRGRCPICFQTIDAKYGAETIKIIESLFDREIENKIEEIENHYINPIIMPDFSEYEKVLSLTQINELVVAINSLNKNIELLNSSLKEKVGSIYSPKEPLQIDLDISKLNVEIKLKNINSTIDEFNNAVREKNILIAEAKDINLNLSYFECLDLIERYNSLIKEEKLSIEKAKKLEENIQKAKERLQELNLQKMDCSIAVNEMNKCLTYIFASSSRLKLQPSKDVTKYHILSKGRRVKAKKLSTGERNAISLVYFYEQLKQNCNEGDYFKERSIYFIDDPISSFDYENKLGILSFLKKILSEIKNGNNESQIAIFTHELEIANFINRIFVDLEMASDSCQKEISVSGVVDTNVTKYSNYRELMKDVLNYGEFGNDYMDSHIGNTIRRLLEAYATFNYNETIDKFLAKSDYLNKINDETLKNYFKIKMDRLILNEESHTENIIRQSPDISNFDLFSKDERIQTAKDIIVLLYCFDSVHIKRYIPTEKERVVKGWLNEIKTNF